MTPRTLGGEHSLALRCQRSIDGKRKRRWRRRPQKLADSLEAGKVHRFPVRAVADGRAYQHFLERRIQAVPMQRAPIAKPERPERRHVGVSNRVVDLLTELTKLERVERIDTAAAPVGPRVHPGKFLAMTNQRLTRARNQEEAVRERLGPRQAGHLDRKSVV